MRGLNAPLLISFVMYKVKSIHSTENNTVFLVPNKCIYPTLSQRISMAANGIPLPDMAQPPGIAKPFLDLEDTRGVEAAMLFEAQNKALQRAEEVQSKLDAEQILYKRYHE